MVNTAVLTSSDISAAGGAILTQTGLSTRGDETIPMLNSVSQGTRTIWEIARITGGVWNDIDGIDVFVDSVAGNDSNPGTYLAPKATIASVTFSPGITVGLKRGSVFREAVTLSYDDVSLVAYGNAGSNRPVIIRSTKITGTWTNEGSNVWSISLASSPDHVILIANYSETGYTKLWKYATTQSSPAVGQFGYTGGKLYVYSTVDPGTLAEVSWTSATGGSITVRLNSNRNLLQDIAVWGATTDGVYFGAAKTGSVVRGCDLSCNTYDGCGGGAVLSALVEHCLIRDNGYAARDGTGADGDGISFHGDGGGSYANNVVIRYNTILRNRKGGIGNQSSANVKAYGNYLENNYWNIAIFVTAFTGGVPLEHDFWNNVLISKANDSQAFVITVAPTYTFTIRMWNNTFYSTSKTAFVQAIRGTETENLTMELKKQRYLKLR